MATKLVGQKSQWPHITKNIDYEKLVQKSDKIRNYNKP